MPDGRKRIMEEKMLKIDHLKKNYGSFRLDCSLEVSPGCITGLVGPNGSGKSTTFKSVLDSSASTKAV